MGEFWNEEGFKENRDIVLKSNKEVGRTFARAYRYLRAAASVIEDNEVIYGWAVDKAKVNMMISGIVNELFGCMPVSENEGGERRLFASAITPEGLKNHLLTILPTERTYVLKGYKGTGADRLLEQVKTEALQRGYDVEAYYCAMKPDYIEHLVIPKLNVSFTTVNEYHYAAVDAYREINLNAYLNQELLNEYAAELNFNKTEFDTLINNAIYIISKAKSIHDKMEKYYIPNMDFEAVNRCREATLARILDIAGVN